MESSYSRYLEIIDHECLEHIDKLVEIRDWVKKRIKNDKKWDEYSKAYDSIENTIKELKSTL